jgi:uncharacterized protein
MQFNVSSLLKEPTGATRHYDIEADLSIDGVTHHVTGRVRFDRTPRGVLVRAAIHGTMDDVCSRCVKPVACPVDLEIAEEYIPTIDVVTGAPVELEEGEEDAYRIDPHHVIDLVEPVTQYWALALPMAPLCDEECRGLCPVCGEEIASPDHACAGEQIDARWSALAKLKLG